jgi:hypothetical protein
LKKKSREADEIRRGERGVFEQNEKERILEAGYGYRYQGPSGREASLDPVCPIAIARFQKRDLAVS